MSKRPKDMTTEELEALPTIGFGRVTRMVDGRRVEFPVMPDIVASAVLVDDLLVKALPDGEMYTFGQYSDGRWFKRRV